MKKLMYVVFLGFLLSACSTETVEQQDQNMNNMPQFQPSPTDSPDEVTVEEDTDQMDQVENIGERRNN